MRALTTAAIAALLTACSGQAKYELNLADGTNVKILNTKDIERVSVEATKSAGGDYQIKLTETGVSASAPAAVSAQTNQALIGAITKLVPAP